MELSSYGFIEADSFIEAGKWMLRENVKSGIHFELHYLKGDRVIYAFVVA